MAVRTTARKILLGPITGNKRLVAIGIPLISIWQLAEAMVPVMIGVTIDVGIETRRLWPFVFCCLGIVALFACLSYGYRWGARHLTRATLNASHRLRVMVAAKAMQPVEDRRLAGEWLSLATADADKVALLVRQLGFAFASGLTVILTGVYLMSLDMTLALVVLFGVPVTVAITQVLSPMVARRTDAEQESIAHVAGLAGDLIAGLRPLKGIGAEQTASQRYRVASQKARRSSIVTSRAWGYMGGLTTLVSGAFLALVAWLAGSRTIDGDLSLGELVAVVGLTQFLAEPISQFGDVSAQFAASRASARRIDDALQSPVWEFSGQQRLTDQSDSSPIELRLDRVSVGPLRELTLTCRPSELLAIVTDTPESADIFIDLVDGKVRPDTGVVELGGFELGSLDRRDRHRALLVLPHTASVPEGTIRHAIDPDGRLTDDELETVLQASAAQDVVTAHPDGLEHHVRSGGTSLSGGQRQRLALARALAADRAVLVLRDPTTAIDSVTEQHIAHGLRWRGRVGRATLVVTSSPTLLAAADRVIWIHDGRITAVGTHQELSQNSDYRAEVLR